MLPPPPVLVESCEESVLLSGHLAGATGNSGTVGQWIIQTALLVSPNSRGKRSEEQHEDVIKFPAEARLIHTDSLVLSPRL